MEDLNLGTKELVSINVEDRMGTITSLASYAVDFRVKKEDGTDQVTWTSAAAIVGMRVDCLLDTAGWSTGHYELFVRPTIGSERPILGPFDFNLI